MAWGYKINDELFAKQAKFDGFYALVSDNTNINVEEVIKIHSSRWQITSPFQKINTEFMQTPEYIKQEYAVNAHLLISTLTLIAWRELLNRLKNISYGWDVASKLREMNFLQIPGRGWIPAFTYDKLMRDIIDVCNLDFDHQLITNEEMVSIIKSIQKN